MAFGNQYPPGSPVAREEKGIAPTMHRVEKHAIEYIPMVVNMNPLQGVRAFVTSPRPLKRDHTGQFSSHDILFPLFNLEPQSLIASGLHNRIGSPEAEAGGHDNRKHDEQACYKRPQCAYLRLTCI